MEKHKGKRPYINRRTLRERISRSISLTSTLSIFTFSVLTIIMLSLLFGAFAVFAGSILSDDIAKEISSPYFLETNKITDLKDFNPNSASAKSWVKNIDKKYKIDLSLESLFANKNIAIKTDRPGPNLKYYAFIKIKLNKNVLYDNEGKMNTLYKSHILSIITNAKSTTKIYSYPKKREIGYVTVNINGGILIFIFTTLVIGLLITSVITMIIINIITSFFTGPIIQPIQLLQRKMKELSNEDIEAALETKLTFKKPPREIEDLANSTNQIMHKLKHYTDLLEDQKDVLEDQNLELEAMTTSLRESNESYEEKSTQIENILNNVGQGFLTFGSSLLIHKQYSYECKSIFGKAIENQTLSSLLYPDNEEQKNFLDSILAKLLNEDDKNKIELYMPLLPDEILINNNSISIEYKIVHDILDKNSKMFMIILTDITEKRKLESIMEEEKNTLKMVVKIMTNHSDFLDCLDEYKDFCSSKLYEIINEKPLEEGILEIFRLIHTFKGNFSQFDLYHFVEKLHNLETEISNKKNNLDGVTKADVLARFKELNLASWIDEDLSVLYEYLGKDFLSKKDVCIVEKSVVLNLERKIIKMLPPKEQKALLPDVRKFRYKSFKELLRTYPEYVLKLSDRMGKMINVFDIKGDDILVDVDHYQDFTKSLVHIFRNCIDHGIESADDRIMKNKSEFGNISCTVEDLENAIRLTISDDGTGIDPDKLRELSVKKKIYTEEEAANKTNEEILMLIFKEEFSTSEKITDISGRGIGLYAVKEELKRINGTVNVKTFPDTGTQFIFTLPKEEIKQEYDISVNKIMDAVLDTSTEFFKQQADINLEDNKTFSSDDKIFLNKVSILLNLRGIIDSVIVFSLNEKLISKLIKSFVIDELTEEEEKECMEDVVAECANIIVGNSIKKLGEYENLVTLGTPTIVCYKGAFIKYPNAQTSNCNLNNNDYDFNISIVLMD